MNLIELFAPAGALSDRQRRRLGERLVTELIRADGAPPEINERGRGLTWLVVHEPEVWTVGGRPVERSDAPRYVVRLNVPGGHMNDGMRAELVSRVTRVIAESEDDPRRVYERPDAWVHINEVPSGNIGGFGQVMPTSDITRMVLSGERPEAVPGTADPSSAPTVIDPICGMTVELDGDAISVEADGTTYGFCSSSCRDVFAAERP
jgi:YHS domain-containing protein/phenylpyruvate tautomerase PptA (4-oxalocrotonate tautomerase family)